MCDFVPGRLIVIHDAYDATASQVISGLHEDGISVVENMSERLRRLDRSINPMLEREFVQIAVPEGEENWWATELTKRYFLLPGSWESSSFAVAPNHILELCALTFAMGPHDAAYRAMMNDSKTSGRGAGVRVAVIDLGLSTASAIAPTSKINLVNAAKPTDTEDNVGHGTAVSEIIYSMAPDTDFIIYKVTDSKDVIEWDVLAALVNDDVPDIVNLSIGFKLDTVACPSCGRLSHSSRSAVFEGALRRIGIVNKKTVLVVASGNDSAKKLRYPARFREAIAVGAVDSTGARSPKSNYGNLDHKNMAHDSLFFAPGGGGAETVGTTNPGSKTYAGTSFAAAYVSGLLAKLQSDLTLKKSDAASLVASLRTSANASQAMSGHVVSDHGNGLIQV